MAAQSEGMSGAEMALICREAGLIALTEGDAIALKEASEIMVTSTHLLAALAAVKQRGTQL